MRRIYDAAFALFIGTEHHHLGTFWWVDPATGAKGQWTRQEAYNFVVNNPAGTVYVTEGADTVIVLAYYDRVTGTQWIQTVADGKLKDNLTTLAKRHSQGLANN
jgi:hypothetical protein